MKHLITILTVVTLGWGVVAAEAITTQTLDNANSTTNAPKKKLTSQQIRNAIKKMSLKRHGGFIRKMGTAKGQLVILNAQKQVAMDKLSSAIEEIDRHMHVQYAIKETSTTPTVANIRTLLTDNDGVVGMALIDDANLPALLTAPEEGWSLINVRSLSKDTPTQEQLEARVRKEVLRAFAFVTGGAYANSTDFVMRDVKTLKDLDDLKYEKYGAELCNRIPLTAPHYGLVPWYQTTYLKACEEGWAPMPTNEYQKAIWEKVREAPKNPMKIEYDPKKGR